VRMVLNQLTLDEIEALDDGEIDPKELSAVVDRLQLKFCRVINHAQKRRDHLAFGPNFSAVGWVSEICFMSRNSASDRLCVGEQIESLPKVAQALRAGEIGYQSVAVGDACLAGQGHPRHAERSRLIGDSGVDARDGGRVRVCMTHGPKIARGSDLPRPSGPYRLPGQARDVASTSQAGLT